MPASPTHAGTQRQAAREQSLLRPQREPETDIQAVYHPQRVLGNAAFARSTPPPADRSAGAPAAGAGIQSIVRRAAFVIQPKLMLGPVDDAYEQEADQVAQQVVQRLTRPAAQRAGLGQETLQRHEDDEVIQGNRAAYSPNALDPDVEQTIQAARTGGSPLPPAVQSSMGNSFGADFSSVRVHTGSQSNQLNNQLQARAFTTGRDIFFRQGEYNPTSPGGQHLLAHELTHVVQQGAAESVRTKRLVTGRVQRQAAYDSLFFSRMQA